MGKLIFRRVFSRGPWCDIASDVHCNEVVKRGEQRGVRGEVVVEDEGQACELRPIHDFVFAKSDELRQS